MRKTKIICTIGPASESVEIIKTMISAGMNVARLNFSHGCREDHAGHIARIREAEQASSLPVAIMLDTSGPEIRTGAIAGGEACLQTGQEFVLTSRKVEGSSREVSVSYPGLAADASPGNFILVDDGRIQLEVLGAESGDLRCRVVNGGVLKPRKSVNIPGVRLNLPFLSEKDRQDIVFGIKQEVDFIAASFARSAEDILEIYRILEENGASIQVIAKIESQEGVDNLDDIIKVADGVMVARGDLGVEIAAEEVPLVQKSIIAKCREAGKSVIIATQMLESMISNPRPTRAEVSDVANAVLDGADAIMLSGESAAGLYPVGAVETMARIAARTELAYEFGQILQEKATEKSLSVTDAVAYATCSTAMHLNIHSIVTATRTGRTARRVARYRPQALILAATPDRRVLKRLSLVWGVCPLLVEEARGTDELMERAIQACIDAGHVRHGELTIFVAGNPTGYAGDTNFMKVHLVSEIILQGMGIGSGTVSGPARIIEDEDDLASIQDGDIMVTHGVKREFVPCLRQVKAIVAEEGGLTSDTAIIGLNLGLPVIVGAGQARRLISAGEIISVDSAHGRVYRGHIQISR